MNSINELLNEFGWDPWDPNEFAANMVMKDRETWGAACSPRGHTESDTT